MVLGMVEGWFTNEDEASSLLTVPKTRINGKMTDRERTALRVWQCVPGISIGKARELYEAVGLPLALTCTDDQLKAVRLVGPKRVRAIKETFGGAAQ